MDLNIIIPTYNRPSHLKRILSYYNGFKEEYRIIVADSSNDKNQKANKDIISSFQDLDILHLTKYNPKTKLSHKLADAVDNADRKYCVFCADDDFIIMSGIKKAVSFLEENSDFSCAHGGYISFSTKQDEQGRKQIHWEISKIYKSITSPSPEERLFLNFSDYMYTFYAVHRTDFLSMLVKENIEYTDDDRFGELLPSMLDVIYNKMKYLDTLYCVREILHDSGGRTSKKIQDFISEGTYDAKMKKFKECLSLHLSKSTQMDLKKAEKIVDKAWGKYTKEHKGYIIPKINYMINKMPLPLFIEKNLRLAYRKITSKKNLKKVQEPYILPENYIEECNAIKKCVLSHVQRETKKDGYNMRD